MNKRDKERETKISPRVLLRFFNTQRSLRARREIHHTNTHVFFIRPKIFPPKLRLEKSRLSKSQQQLRGGIQNIFLHNLDSNLPAKEETYTQ
jgi:hypothetical protein